MSPTEPSERILGPGYLTTTVGMFSLIAFVAFEAMAVTAIMPTVARTLDGVALYALSFAAPLASGVVGMVAAGMASDRRGPVAPLLASMALFSLGLVVCGTASSMEVLVAGRVLQGLGGGALTVGLYVVVGLVYPAALQPAIFASFAAAWVLPALVGPAVAASVADAVGWRWVFLGTVAFVVLAAVLIWPTLRRLEPHPDPTHTPAARLAWAGVGALAVLALDLLGSAPGPRGLAALLAFAVVILSLRRLLPAGSLLARPGLPAVIATRGLLAATFFCAQAYIAFVLQERWGLSAGRAGLALTAVGVVWALGSQAQSRLGTRVSHRSMMRVGTLLVFAGLALLAVAVWQLPPSPAAGAAFVLAGLGMGVAYPRTSIAMLAASTDRDRGFNSSALTVADSLGAALALSICGVVYAAAERAGGEPFTWVFLVAAVLAAAGLVAAART